MFIRKHALLAIACLVTFLGLANIASGAGRAPIVAQYQRSAGPTAIRLAEAFDTPSEGLQPSALICPDYNSSVANLANRAEFTGVLVQQWPTKDECFTIASRYHAAGDSPAYRIGERRLAVIVNPRNPIKAISLIGLQRVLASPESQQQSREKHRDPVAEWPRLPANSVTWSEFGGANLLVQVYSEGTSSWTRETLKDRCLRHVHWWLGDAENGTWIKSVGGLTTWAQKRNF